MKVAMLFISCLAVANVGTFVASLCSGRTCTFLSGESCQCDSQCSSYGNCCSDYTDICSCSGRCGTTFDGSKGCQCNTACLTYGDCCSDYSAQCEGGSGGGCSFTASSTFTALADCLWDADVHRIASSRYTYQKQTFLSNYNEKVDRSSTKLFSYFDTSILNEPTISLMVDMFNNYNPQEGQTESFTASENNEKTAFLDAVMATDVMTTAYNYLSAKGLVSSISDLRSKIERAWFLSYKRQATGDSSAFEHTFLGEWKSSTAVNGFHNWIRYYLEENSGDINYFGYTGEDQPDMLGLQFSWGSSSRVKTRTSLVFGVSPEFELAIFTSCFLEKPGTSVSFSLQDNPMSIQTWNFSGDNTVIGSAYFEV